MPGPSRASSPTSQSVAGQRLSETATARTQLAARQAVAALMRQHNLGVRRLAREVGVSPSHLSRALRERNGKEISGHLAARIARALGLPHDYFPETRCDLLVDAIRDRAELRESLYADVLQGQERQARTETAST